MLENFTIFTRSGLVIWQYCPSILQGNPINEFIKVVLLEERSGSDSYSYDRYVIKWIQANEKDLIFVAVYQKILSLSYIDDLLTAVKAQFMDSYGDKIHPFENYPFDEQFGLLLREIPKQASKKRTKLLPPLRTA